MRLYYGTASTNAAKIRRRGICPSSSRGVVWFSRTLPVARSRARQMSAGRRGRPAVVVCDVDLVSLRRRWGRSAVRCRGPMVALRGAVQPHQVTDVVAVDALAGESAEPERVLTAGEVVRMLDSRSPRVRMMGVLMLSARGSTEAFDWLCTRLDDPDPRVRLAVVAALRRRGRPAADVLSDMGRDRDPRIRRAAHRALRAVPARA